MSGIEPSQSWGFPPVARPRWRVFFKTGALPSRGLFHEVALLERDGVELHASRCSPTAIRRWPTAKQTIEGVAQRLLARTP